MRWPRFSITEPQERVKPIACDAEYQWLTPAISLIEPWLMVVMIRETRVAVACINRKKFSVFAIALDARSGTWALLVARSAAGASFAAGPGCFQLPRLHSESTSQSPVCRARLITSSFAETRANPAFYRQVMNLRVSL